MFSPWQVSVYADGEITAKAAHSNSIIQGRQKGQKAQPYGVNRKGRNNIRRATNGYISYTRVSQPIFITLTTQHHLPDSLFKRYVANWIKRGLTLHPMFKNYVVSYELHQSGQMHAHILMFQEMPYDVFISQRELWANYYDNGVYSFDIKPVLEKTAAAAGYLAKLPRYMAKDIDDVPRPIHGRTYTISQALQPYTKPVSAPVSVSRTSLALEVLADNAGAILKDDYYLRLQTGSASDAFELLNDLNIPAVRKDIKC